MMNLLLGMSEWMGTLRTPLTLRAPGHILPSIQTSNFSSTWQKIGKPCHLHRKENNRVQLNAQLVIESIVNLNGSSMMA